MPFKRQQIISVVLLLVGGVFAISQALKPDPREIQFRVEGNMAYVFGGTNTHSVNKVSRFISKNPQVDTLVLTYMPGTKDTHMNLRIARRIRAAGLKTHLTSESYIASGAVDLFLAGTERTMECGAKIGVHSWSIGGKYGPEDIGKDRSQREHERFLEDMGVDPAFYVFTREAARPEDIHILTADEIARFGVLTEAGGCRTKV